MPSLGCGVGFCGEKRSRAKVQDACFSAVLCRLSKPKQAKARNHSYCRAKLVGKDKAAEPKRNETLLYQRVLLFWQRKKERKKKRKKDPTSDFKGKGVQIIPGPSSSFDSCTTIPIAVSLSHLLRGSVLKLVRLASRKSGGKKWNSYSYSNSYSRLQLLWHHISQSFSYYLRF